MHQNGNSFEMGLLWGELKTHMRMQTDVLLEIKDSIEVLPCRISSAIATPETSKSQAGRLLPELSELIRALYPVLILLAALTGRMYLPETGVLKAVLGAIMDGSR